MSVASQKGFTLIELMISLVLGLLIAAAVMQVYIMSIRTNNIQESGSNIQNASIFGLQRLEDGLRLANLGSSHRKINGATPAGGVVLTDANLAGIGPDMVTRDNAHPSNVNNVNSDQLTISYRNVSGRTMFDCQGNAINPDEMAIERYFLSGTAPNLHLFCDAGRATTNADGVPTGITEGVNGPGTIFMENVDQFKVLIGAQDETTFNVGYLTVGQYQAMNQPIVSIRVAVLSRGGTPILGEQSATRFTIFGREQTLVADARPQVRAVYETNVLLRNARLMHVS
ncbi:MAG: PilW family protein [Moraxella equi]|nr:PilW family protein [Moraxella equi]